MEKSSRRDSSFKKPFIFEFVEMNNESIEQNVSQNRLKHSKHFIRFVSECILSFEMIYGISHSKSLAKLIYVGQ